MYKVDLNSQTFFSTKTNNSTGNRKYGIDFSFLEDKKYLVRFDLQQRWNEGTITMNDNWNVSGYTYNPVNYGPGGGTITATRSANNLRLTMNNSTDPVFILEGASRPAINTNTFKYIHLRYKVVSGNVDNLVLFYYTTVAGGNGSSVSYNYGNNVILNKWYNIVFDMTNVSAWTTGSWNKYRLDPIVQGTAVIDFEYFVISNSPNYPYNLTDFNNLVRINLGGVCENNIVCSNNVRRTPTNFSGLLQAKKSGVRIQQYCKSEHNPPFVLHGRPSDNFVEVDLCDTDFNVSYITADYNMSLYFEPL